MKAILISRLMALDEIRFIKELQTLLIDGAMEGDVIPLMIQYNVPLYVLTNIWPEKDAELRNQNLRLAFAVAEDGWQGKVKNVQSRLVPQATADHFVLSFAKSYVIECDTMLVLVRYADGFAICPVDRDETTQDWQSRQQNDVLLPARNGTKVDHYRVRATLPLRRAQFHPISQKAYARLGMQIPLREASSLSLLGLALLRRAGIDTESMQKMEMGLLEARGAGRLRRKDMAAVRELMGFFYDCISRDQLSVHPFWMRARDLFKAIPE